MGYITERSGRFTAYYKDESGKRRSAGTFDTRKEAIKASERAEALGAEATWETGLTLNEYVPMWLKNTPDDVLKPITKVNYKRLLEKHVLPTLGTKRVGQITRPMVRALIRDLIAKGMKPATAEHVKTAIGSAYKPLIDEDMVEVSPTAGIRIKKDDPDPYEVISPEEFRMVLKSLPNDSARTFAMFLIGSGCRFGEATEVRVSDVNFKRNEVVVRRRVSDVGAKHNGGERFLVVEGTKSGFKRVVVLSPALMSTVGTHIAQHKLSADDLLFPLALVSPCEERPEVTVGESFMVGTRTFQHGTHYAYASAKCRCDLCRSAVAEYRYGYRRKYRRGMTVGNTNVSGHLPRDVWRRVWRSAIEQSGIGWFPRTHDLRHTHVTQLLESGIPIHEVKERVGHRSVTTTEGYAQRAKHRVSNAALAVDGFIQ